MPGHLFVVRGDLTQLACDAWLLPTSRTLWIEDYWLKCQRDCFDVTPRPHHVYDKQRQRHRNVSSFEGKITTPTAWRDEACRTFEWAGWKPKPGQSRPWLTAMAKDDESLSVDERAEWYAEGARQFVVAAAQAFVKRKPANNRLRPLLAVPVVGTGAGGGAREAGVVIGRLVTVLLSAVKTVDADIAIVAYTADQFAAVQQARLSHRASAYTPWELLPEHLIPDGKMLAAKARAGGLALFFGAGASMGAGLPHWQRLLSQLASVAGMADQELRDLRDLDVLDQARIVRDRLERDPDGTRYDGRLASEITKITDRKFYALTHALLASLPIAEAVTTNYDTLFEQASAAAQVPTAVLPYQSPASTKRWLLKMHGCIKHGTDDIVLTREDFLRYTERSGALARIVQALLITRHMLFVGFSLTDSNFLRIADEVRKVVRRVRRDLPGTNSEPFGTALMTNHPHLLPMLWNDDIRCVAISDAPRPSGERTDEEKQKTRAQEANSLEIFLDYVLAESNHNTEHLLDSRYDWLLSPDERELRAILNELQAKVTLRPRIRETPAWQPVQALLDSLGAKTDG